MWLMGHCASCSTSSSICTSTKPLMPPPSRQSKRPRPIGTSLSSSLADCSSSYCILSSSSSSCVDVDLSFDKTSFLAAAATFDVNIRSKPSMTLAPFCSAVVSINVALSLENRSWLTMFGKELRGRLPICDVAARTCWIASRCSDVSGWAGGIPL